MTREEIVAALREHAEWAAGNEWETPITLGDDLSVAADLIENQQREIEALRQANEGLRFHLAALHGSGGHPDPVGPKGQMAACPICGGMCDWAPETDISTCRCVGVPTERRKSRLTGCGSLPRLTRPDAWLFCRVKWAGPCWTRASRSARRK